MSEVALGAEKVGAKGVEPANSMVGSTVFFERERLVEALGKVSSAMEEIAGSTALSAGFLAGAVFAAAFLVGASFAAAGFALSAFVAGFFKAEAFWAAGVFLTAALRTGFCSAPSTVASTGTFESFLVTISGVLQAAFG
jgi:hypothetical protein